MSQLIKALDGLDGQQRLVRDCLAYFEGLDEVTAACLIGSVARGAADSLSDIDILFFTGPGFWEDISTHSAFLEQSRNVVYKHLDFHEGPGSFAKYIFDDFTSIELHLIEQSSDFPLYRPYYTLFDKNAVLASLEKDGEPPTKAETPVYVHGDDGLTWELFNAIKALQRGKIHETKTFLTRLVDASRE